jgi:ubiquinone biosynthesis protein
MISVVSAVRDLGRLREISAVLVRHGFGEVVARIGLGGAKLRASTPPPPMPDGLDVAAVEYAHGEDEKKQVSGAERMRFVLQDLGPSFIKLGQILSTRKDVLPDSLILELQKLQDNVPAVPFADIKAVVEASLGASIADVYESFDETPLASASIGQVHRAVLATADGKVDVVVKVQRPGVGSTVARDLEILHLLAAALERTVPETRIYSPVGLVQQFDQSITSELNFIIEADNADRFARNFKGHTRVHFPAVYRQASAKQVLTEEFLNGKKIERAVADGASGPGLAREAVGVIVKMVFEDGFFHADPHPGNIIILGTPEDPVFGLIDVGMVGRLSPELRDLTLDLLVAAVRKDSYAVADALYAIGRPTRKVDMRAYRGEASLLAEKYLGRPLKEIEMSSLIFDLIKTALKYGIEIPTDFMLVGKALVAIDGIGKTVDPDLDVYGTASPALFDLVKKRYSPERIGNELWRSVEQLSKASFDMPMQLREVLDDLRLGRLSLRTVDPALPRTADRLGRRLYTGLIVASLLGSGTVLLQGQLHPVVGIVMLGLAGVIWVIQALRDLKRSFSRSPSSPPS